MRQRPAEPGGTRLERLSSRLGRLWKDPQDRAPMAIVINALDARYDLSIKIATEEGVQDILEQMVLRMVRAFGRVANIQGKRILDIACGSNSSRAPSSIRIDTPSGERRTEVTTRGYTALFEPWFCRILLEFGADPVGVDFGDLDGEAFEHYRVDLGQIGALDFLPSHSFDAVQDSRLFGSPEFTAMFPKMDDRRRVAAENRCQEQRVLKAGGIVIHSDAKKLLSR